jgi:hypothetical protein
VYVVVILAQTYRCADVKQNVKLMMTLTV